jgi:S-phase kinase-associated protein 1
VGSYPLLLPISTQCLQATVAQYSDSAAVAHPPNLTLRLLLLGGQELCVASDSGFVQNCAVLRDLVTLEQNAATSAAASSVCCVPLYSVQAEVLGRIVEFAEHHEIEPYTEIEKPLKTTNMRELVSEYDVELIESVEPETLFSFILAANFLGYHPLMELMCAGVASIMKGKEAEEIRKTFNIVNDFTPAEEQQVREENKWCEEA